MSDAELKKSRIRTIKFAALLSLVCCLLITTASQGLKGYQQENMEVDRQKNILEAAGLIQEGTAPGADLIKKNYREYITEVDVGPSGRMQESSGEDTLKLYLYRQKGEIVAYIIPIVSRGLWGKIMGYIAFENDGQTVAGFTVYSHSETPGLGGEIESAWFKKNFKGKKVLNQAGRFVSVGIAKGSLEVLPEEKRENYVDGISGATLTGKYLSQGIKQTLEQYEPVSVRFRQQNTKHIR